MAATLVMVTASPLSAYSVLSHEAMIDVTWDSAIVPLLKQRFPRASADGLLRARSFANGGWSPRTAFEADFATPTSIAAGRVTLAGMPVALTRNILTFYGEGPGPSVADKKVRKRLIKAQPALQELRDQSSRRASSSVE